ncbi:unnamed protein product [marine sediment metagenome]|uniref:Uncharacterized protein n=1 Tax=marine sediment metagenome TaxID=412755 RepID=X0X2D7_9ZZZZ
MAKSHKVVDGKLQTTETKDTVVSDMTREEVVGKIAEIQTEIDHMRLDLTAKEAEKAEWAANLALLDA